MNHKIYTIGFGQKNAKCFFGLLWANGIRKVIDVRLNNVSQLAGFTKKQDLEFFLAEICQCGYEHQAQWAPTKELLDSYKKKQISWNDYEKIFLQIMKKRNVLESVDALCISNSCLLCSEPTPERCHRRLLAEHLKTKFPSLEIIHL